jgi:hypothetical protein
LTHRIVRPAAGPKAMAVVGKGRIDAHLQDLQQGLLDQPICHRRDAKRALSMIALMEPPVIGLMGPPAQGI